jgi:hypothetical protein
MIFEQYFDSSIYDDDNNCSIIDDDDNVYPSHKIIKQIFDTENNKQVKIQEKLLKKNRKIIEKNKPTKLLKKFRKFIETNKPTDDFINKNSNINIPENNFIFYLTELIRFFEENQKYRKFAFVTCSLNIACSFYFYKSIDNKIYVIFKKFNFADNNDNKIIGYTTINEFFTKLPDSSRPILENLLKKIN